MRDQPLTIAEAASWLNASEQEITDLLGTGRLRPFRADAPDGRVSLNSVVVLAEALPVERRVFEVRESSIRLDGPPTGPRPSHGPRPGGHDSRGPVIVERRPTRSFTPR